VAAHAERLHLQQRRALARPGSSRRLLDGVDHGEDVVAVDHRTWHPVADGAVGEVGARVLLAGRRRQAPPVVLDDEQHRQAPHGRQVEGLVEVALAGAAVAREHGRHPPLPAEHRRQRQAVGHGEHRPEVRDHPDDAVVE
jgi:hypothetical protein